MSDLEIDEVRTCRREISALFGHDIHVALDYYRGIKRNLDAEEQTAFPPNQMDGRRSVRTADPTIRPRSVGSAVRTNDLAVSAVAAMMTKAGG
jgi:hypothetical protein